MPLQKRKRNNLYRPPAVLCQTKIATMDLFLTTDHDPTRASQHDLAVGQGGGIIAGQGGVTHTGSGFAINHDGHAAHRDIALVGGRNLEWASGWNVRRRIGSHAADGCSGLAFNFDVGAAIAVDCAVERAG